MPPRQLGKASALLPCKSSGFSLLTFEIEDLIQAITDRLPLLLLLHSFKQLTSLPKPFLIRESDLLLPLNWLH